MENNLQTIYLAGGCFWGIPDREALWDVNSTLHKSYTTYRFL